MVGSGSLPPAAFQSATSAASSILMAISRSADSVQSRSFRIWSRMVCSTRIISARKKLILRAEMMRVEQTMRDQIRNDLDCTESALLLMAMRMELAALVADWKAAGGSDPLPTIEERLKANHRPAQKPKLVA